MMVLSISYLNHLAPDVHFFVANRLPPRDPLPPHLPYDISLPPYLRRILDNISFFFTVFPDRLLIFHDNFTLLS